MPDNLFKRGQIWWARREVDGREYRRSLRTADKVAARKRRDRWFDELSHLAFHGEERPSYRDAVVRWAAEYLPSSVKPSTAARYRLSLKALHGTFDGLYIDQVTSRRISEFVSARKQQHVTNATIRRDLTALSTIFTCCVAWGWTAENPAKAYDRSIIRERRDPIRLPTDAEILAVVLKAPPMMGRLLMLLLQTGMRLEEAGGLERRQLELRTGEILLLKTKTSRPRVVPLTDAAAGTLSGTPAHLHSPWLFWHGEGDRYRNLSTNLAKIIGRILGRDAAFRVHDLRHRFAVDYLRAHPQDIYELSKVLGHSSVKTTEIYTGYLARNPAQVQRSEAQWPYAKPLQNLSYDQLFRAPAERRQVVL